MSNALLTKTYVAGGAITKYRIVKIGAADGAVLQATAATEVFVGVSTELDAASGARVDVHLFGLIDVEYGGNVTRGTRITADSAGKAVTGATGNQTLGIAMVTGAAGDIGSVLIDRHVLA